MRMNLNDASNNSKPPSPPRAANTKSRFSHLRRTQSYSVPVLVNQGQAPSSEEGRLIAGGQPGQGLPRTQTWGDTTDNAEENDASARGARGNGAVEERDKTKNKTGMRAAGKKVGFAARIKSLAGALAERTSDGWPAFVPTDNNKVSVQAYT
jgi:hypothetical protein